MDSIMSNAICKDSTSNNLRIELCLPVTHIYLSSRAWLSFISRQQMRGTFQQVFSQRSPCFVPALAIWGGLNQICARFCQNIFTCCLCSAAKCFIRPVFSCFWDTSTV